MAKGIRARTGRRGFGQTPWGRRWVEELERRHSASRLQRGRTYARAGHVLSLAATEAGVQAKVQGSRPSPYRVQITFSPLPEQTLAALAELSSEPRLRAEFAEGKLPESVEAELGRRGISLFPTARQDYESACSCPDWENPCKHVAAVYYLIAEEFDRDPLLLFTLRGLPRAAVQAALAGAEAAEAEPEAPPLPTDPAAFWGGARPPQAEPWPPPATDAAALRLCGPFPFWPGPRDLQEELEDVYRVAGERT